VPNPSTQSPSPTQCAFEQQWFDTTVVISCAGEIDSLTSPAFEHEIASAMEKQPAAMIVDMTDVDFLGSCGMGVLVDTNDRITPDVAFAVVADGPVTRRPMTLIGLSEILTIHPTLEAALAK
jgi:anti-sigma B factor antagonist